MKQIATCFTLFLFFLVTLLLIAVQLDAQITANSDTIDIANLKLSQNIRQAAFWYVDKSRSLSPEKIPVADFKERIPEKISRVVPPYLVEQDVYLKFTARNSRDTAIHFYFIPGFYYDTITLFSYNPATHAIQPINSLPPDNHEGVKKITLGAKQVQTIIARLHFVKTNTNSLNPVLASEDFLPSLLINYRSAGKDANTFTFVFSGILLMMILYSVAVFVINGNREFLYYSGYAFFMGMLFFLKSYLNRSPGAFNYFFESYFDFVIQSVGTFIYISFLRSFIEAKKNFPFLHRIFFIEQTIILCSITLFSFLNFFRTDFIPENTVESITKYSWIVFTVIFIAYTFYARSKLLNYLAIGHSFLLCFGLVSLYLISSPNKFGTHVPAFFNNAIIYYELGLGIELIFFLVALAFKNRNDIIERTKERESLKLKSQRQELEKQMAILSATQEERNRISADMHDELGSGVTAIRLMSEIVKAKMKEQTLPEIDRISSSANDLINKMNTIIWTMKSENDTLESLITYIRIYAIEFFENTNIDCSVILPEKIPNIVLSGEKRRNIFLCVKESLNNILKHSKATTVSISFQLKEKIIIHINDNGVGVHQEKLRQFGNGLSNMKKRMEGVKGEFLIENNNGTMCTLTIPS